MVSMTSSLRSRISELMNTMKELEGLLQSARSNAAKAAGGGGDAGGGAQPAPANGFDGTDRFAGCCGAKAAPRPGNDDFVPRPPAGVGGGSPAAAPNGNTGIVGPNVPATGSSGPVSKSGDFAGDSKAMPSWGGFAWSRPDPAKVAKAGFDWFEVGYPTTYSPQDYQQLRDAGVRPFAYVNMGETTPELKTESGNVPVLKHNGDWNTDVVDVRDPKWQDWLIKRANFAYDRGARGIKWDCAGVEKNYQDPAQQKQAVDAMAKVMATLKAQHPDLKQVVNQGYQLALTHPDLVDGVETESMMSAMDSSDPGMRQWAGEEIAKLKDIKAKGIPVIMAEYGSPQGGQADRWMNTIQGMGFTPYITNVQWNIGGRGLGVNPGWI